MVEPDMIYLGQRHVETPIPCYSAINRNRRSAVIGFDHPASVMRDPESMVILMHGARIVVKRLAAVARFDEIFGCEKDVVTIGRIDVEAAHIERALIDQRVARHHSPVRTAVVRSPQQAGS